MAADFSLTNGVTCLLEALKKRNYVKVQIPGLEELQVFVPCGLMDQRPLILQLLNAAAGKDCSKEPDEIAEDDAYLLMSKHGAGDSATDSDWAQWDGELLKLVPQMEAVDTLRAMKVRSSVIVLPLFNLLDVSLKVVVRGVYNQEKDTVNTVVSLIIQPSF